MKPLVATKSPRATHVLGADARDAANDPVVHSILARESSGCGLSAHKKARCSCGWVGPQRDEADDFMSTQLVADESWHVRTHGGM